MPPDFTVFIPVYSEEEILAQNVAALKIFLTGLDLNDSSWDILIADNGSIDRTRNIGSELARQDSRVRFLSIPERAPGSALREALRLIKSKSVITMDADLSADLDFIPRALELLKTRDLVIGSKKMGVETRSWARRLGSDFFIWCSKKLLGLPYDDFSLGAKAYKTEFLRRHEALIGQDTSYVQRLVFAAQREGLPIAQIPVACKDLRKSRFNLLTEGLRRFAVLFQLSFSRKS